MIDIKVYGDDALALLTGDAFVNLQTIEEADKINEFYELISKEFSDIPHINEISSWLENDFEEICEKLDIKENLKETLSITKLNETMERILKENADDDELFLQGSIDGYAVSVTIERRDNKYRIEDEDMLDGEYDWFDNIKDCWVDFKEHISDYLAGTEEHVGDPSYVTDFDFVDIDNVLMRFDYGLDID